LTAVVLASTSASRAAILRAAGVPFQIEPPRVDEDRAKTELLARSADPHAIAGVLAQNKALEVSGRMPGLVIGADQTLELDGALVDKATDLAQARRGLERLRGRAHRLHAAVAVACGGSVLWRETACARMHMRPFSDRFLDGYLTREGETILPSVGCYRLEGEGVQLFEAIEGDYFAILGLPLLGLLAFLRERGAITP